MILGKTDSEIVKLAVDYQSAMFDGVVQYNYKTGKLFGAGFTTGTLENPANPFVEVFRLSQGERGEIDCDCNECPFRNEEARYKGWEKLFPATRKECCIEAYTNVNFTDDWEENWREIVEEQIRDVLSDHLGDTISKLNEIRIELSDRFEPWNYVNVRQENWEIDVLDFYVDNAMENGFTTTVSPRDWLDAEIESICFGLEEDKEYVDFVHTLRDGDFDGALKLLQ